MNDLNNEDPTLDFYGKLSYAHKFYNEKLFNGELSEVFFTVRSGETKNKKTKTLGYYWQHVFAKKERSVSEIALNISSFGDRSVVDILSTLVHEMVHQWREEICKIPSTKNKYGGHDEDWGHKMILVGLTPSNTGLPGGKRIAKSMHHYINEDGDFAKYTKELILSGFKFDIFDTYGMHINKGVVSISPINSLIKEKWEKDVSNEEMQILSASLNTMSDDPNIVQVDIENLIVTKKEPKPKEKKYTFICPDCNHKITGNENTMVACMQCGKVYERKVKK